MLLMSIFLLNFANWIRNALLLGKATEKTNTDDFTYLQPGT